METEPATKTSPGNSSMAFSPPLVTQEELLPPEVPYWKHPVSHLECSKVLVEALRLVLLNPKTSSENEKLHFLVNTFFQTGSRTSDEFRSVLCHDNISIPVSMADFNKYVVQPSSNFELRLGDQLVHSPIQFQRIEDPAIIRTNLLGHAYDKINFVLDNLEHERLHEIQSYRTGLMPVSWLNSILGLEGRRTILKTEVPSLVELQTRIGQSISYSFEAKSEGNSRQPFFTVSSGLAWRSNTNNQPQQETTDYERLELLAMSKFPAFLHNFLQQKRKYIDELAGADVPYYVPEVAQRFAALIDKAPDRRVVGIPLKRRSSSPPEEIGGTVVAIHQFLSPAFLAYFTTDQDSCAYMDDFRSKHKKDRKIRVSSIDHVNSKPVWVQFGEQSDPYLYLSQKASAGEELWLKIVNYLMGLLENFVNDYVQNAVQEQKGSRWYTNTSTVKVYKAPRYATNVAACGDPLVSLFGKHTDSRPGLTSEDIPMFSRDNLIVPTGCIQNHCQAITTISWYSNEDPSFEAGSVTQEMNLIHMQLKTVQVYWKHAVSSMSPDSKVAAVSTHLDFAPLSSSSTLSQGKTIAGATIAQDQFYNPDLTNIGEAGGETNQDDEASYIYNSGLEPAEAITGVLESSVSTQEHESEDEPRKQETEVEELDREDSGIEDLNSNKTESDFLCALTTNRLKRMTLSARATSGLQSAGMKYIKDEVTDGRMKKPNVYGLPWHYQVANVWGATDALHHTMFGTRPTTDPSVDMGPVCYTKIFKAAGNSRKRTRVVIHHCDLSKYRHLVRTVDKPIWPKPNPKIVVSVKTAAVMMTSEPIVDLLIKDGILPLVKHPRPYKKGEETTFMDIPFGPFLDPDTNQPLPMGRSLSASSTYSRYGMKLLSGHNEAWKAVACAASALLLRLAEKNGLQLDLPKQDRLSPVNEMERIATGKKRLGIIVKRSGGNCTLKGQAPPAEAARTAGEGAFFEHDQSIKNPYNFAMEILVEQGTPVAVWGAGELVPRRFEDEKLASDTDNAEQVFYFGCYKVERSPIEEAKTEDEILQVIEEYKEDYPNLSFLNLRFMLKKHQGYRLVPVEYPHIEGGYHYLPVDVRDNRRPKFEVPGVQSFEKALGAGNSQFFNETSMLTAWFKEGGIYEYTNELYLEEAGSKKKKRNRLEDQGDEETDAMTESAFRLLAPQDGTGIEAPALAKFEKKSRTLVGQWGVVCNCAIGSFSRLMELNVDRSGKIGPLLDSNQTYHHGLSSLDNYMKIFNTQPTSGVERQYMKALKPTSVQKSATPHGIRTYDTGKLLLMLGNGGCKARLERKGIGYVKANLEKVVDMTLQSFLVEVFRVPVFLEWSDVKNKRDSTTGVGLPLLSEIDEFIDFLADVMTVNKFQTARNLLQTQYEVHVGLASMTALTRLLRFLCDELQGWLTQMVTGITSSKVQIDAFDICRSSLASLLSRPDALGTWNIEKMEFLSQHILMNLNELIDDWPFGEPDKVVRGFGGLFGAKRLVRGVDGDLSVAAVLQLQLTAVRQTYSTSELRMVGLERLEGTSIVVVSVNQRPVCLVDCEHFGCLDMISSERETGGARGSGISYQVTAPHCHPVPHAGYYERSKEVAAIAIAALQEHKARVDSVAIEKLAAIAIAALQEHKARVDSVANEKLADDNLAGGTALIATLED